MAEHPEAAQVLALALVQAVKENPALVAQMAQQANLQMPAQMPKFGGWQKEGKKRGGDDDDEYYYYADDKKRRKEAVKAPRSKEDASKAALENEAFYLDEIFGAMDANGDGLLSKDEALANAAALGFSEDDIDTQFAQLDAEQVPLWERARVLYVKRQERERKDKKEHSQVCNVLLARGG